MNLLLTVDDIREWLAEVDPDNFLRITAAMGGLFCGEVFIEGTIFSVSFDLDYFKLKNLNI